MILQIVNKLNTLKAQQSICTITIETNKTIENHVATFKE